MAKHEIISGQKSVWQIQNKTGEGDAGEIYQVASMSSSQTAFLKRPVMSAFRGDIFRQSSQIRTEARIITALNNAASYDDSLRVNIPRLLDQSKPGPEYNEGNFIIIEKAEGLDLGLLARVARKGLDSQEELELSPSEEGRALLREIAATGRIPELLLVDVLTRLAHYLDFIHHLQSNETGKPTEGIIWNDVKPDHLFWDPTNRQLTVIDWGNARFLESDQTTVNRQFTWMDDFRQFFDEMGRFLNGNAPDLIGKLGWADFANLKTIPPRSIEEIKTRLSVYFRQLTQPVENEKASTQRRKSVNAGLEITPTEIQNIQNQIKDFGDEADFQPNGSPEYWTRYLTAFTGRLSRENRLDDLKKFCRWASALENVNPDYWHVIDILVGAAEEADDDQSSLHSEVIRDAASMDWEDVVWKIATKFNIRKPSGVVAGIDTGSASSGAGGGPGCCPAVGRSVAGVLHSSIPAHFSSGRSGQG
ncbi:MAG: phosphotransferase [Anaerolineaceae bacterium]